jgi:hypothetical protein
VRQRRGSALFLSSAATLAFGTYTIPVYEIYKVGEDLHWKQGLDYFRQYGLSLSIVPHWNNQDGGDELDTSRCYIGRERFERLLAMLPPAHPLVGIDEHTALVIDFADGCCRVLGNDSVTLLQDGTVEQFQTGSSFPLGRLGAWEIPAGHAGLPQEVWEEALAAEAAKEAASQAEAEPPAEVESLAQARVEARAAQDWERADSLREQIAALGWQVMDTRDGSRILRKADG